MSNPQPHQNPSEKDMDEELALTFLTYYHALELALVRAGFVRAGRIHGSAHPDWDRFARHIEQQFDPDSSPLLQGAVAYLLWHEDNQRRRNERLDTSSPWETHSPHSDIVWISELVQQTRNRLAYGLNFPGKSGCDSVQVSAALFIIESWSHMDPEVERLLKSGL